MHSEWSETHVTPFQRLGILFVRLENSLENLDVSPKESSLVGLRSQQGISWSFCLALQDTSSLGKALAAGPLHPYGGSWLCIRKSE